MVVDTSILLALAFNEESAPWCLNFLREHLGRLVMSTVNLTETLIVLRDRKPDQYDQLRDKIDRTPIIMIPPTASHAEVAAKARHDYPLNLGDCFAYALAKEEGGEIITLDQDFLKTDLKVFRPQ